MCPGGERGAKGHSEEEELGRNVARESKGRLRHSSTAPCARLRVTSPCQALAGPAQLDAMVISLNFSLAIYGQESYPGSRLLKALSALWESSRKCQKILIRQNQGFFSTGAYGAAQLRHVRNL